MAIDNPPLQEPVMNKSNPFFSRIWLRWFDSVYRDNSEGYSGSFTNGDGNTVTVVNGKITDVS